MKPNLLDNSEYKNWLKNLKKKVLQAQIKAAIKVNSILLQFYWELGNSLLPN